MSTFFLLVEILSYGFAFYLLFEKKELAIIYLPVLIFSNTIIEPVFPAFIYYGTISFLILSCIVKNDSFYRKNIYAVLLFLYFLYLVPRSSNLVLIRHDVFSVLWLFASIPLIGAVYQKYSKDEVFKEITNAAFIILILFIANVVFSTVYRYAPNPMYGITTGIMYGNLFGAGFNILAPAVFITVLKLADNRKFIPFIVLIISLAFILLTMRRSVMLVSSVGVAIAILTLLTQKEAKKFIVFGSLILAMGYVIYTDTGFMDVFKERYESRKLDDRPLDEEKRFIEYDLIYNDMFVYNAYSPWFGFELFNSAGNYGKGIFELRSLHGDLPSIAHSSGVLGVILYLLMVITAFQQSVSAAVSSTDKLIIFFCALTFITFTITGRFTEAGSMLLLYIILMLPLAEASSDDEDLLLADDAD